MIDNTWGNRTNVLVLRFLIKFKNQFFSADEISKETGAGLKNVYDSLNLLSYENLLAKRISQGKCHYKFVADTSIKNLISQFFDEEQKQISLRNVSFYKIISEVESAIIKIAGSNLVDIIIYGSVAKGRDTISSDIDLCVLIGKENEKMKQEIKRVVFENKFKKEIQIHVFTSKEFMLANESENPLVRDIVRDGLSLKVGK